MNMSVNSVPMLGLTENFPGKGGPFVAIEIEEKEDWPNTEVHVRLNA